MSGQPAKFTIENSTIDSMPSTDAYLHSQLFWKSHSESDVQFPMYEYNFEDSSNWLLSDSEWMLRTSSEIDPKVAEILLIVVQQPDKRIERRLWESLAEYISRGAIGFRARLVQALDEIDRVADEARSEGYQIPGTAAIDNAKRIIKCIYDNLSHPFQVYPMPDGEVAVDVTNDDGNSVLILSCSDGGTLCFVNINGNQRRARYSNSDALPDCFMHEALEELHQNINS